MLWMLFGCTSESVDVQEPVVKNEVLSQGAETVIQHLQTQLELLQMKQTVSSVVDAGVDWVQPLATFLGEQPVSDVSEPEMMRLWSFQLSKATQFRNST